MTDEENRSGSEEPTKFHTNANAEPDPQNIGSLEETCDSAPNQQLNQTFDSSDSRSAESANSGSLVPEDSRYEIHSEIARGGMGAVLRGRDSMLQRDLAIKVLLDGKRSSESAYKRFVEEAQIGGQLQHPGIVPVYDMGQLADQSPFFAMKLVEGDTLSFLLKQRESPEEDLSRFLGVFEQVCQTVAFAHSKNVIHRDLKPSNVMVGAFGEVQVMDWGLAKVLGSTADTDSNETFNEAIASNNTDEPAGQTISTKVHDNTAGSETRYGSVLGTLGYMPPEQAAGQLDKVDARADVFSLGAILCQILTGVHPYHGSTSNEILIRSIRGELQPCFDRLEECGADKELRDLATKCLHGDANARLQDASVVANRVTAYRESVAEKLRSAEIERASSAARAEEAIKTATAERKKRQLVGLLAGLGVALCAIVGIGGFVIQKNRSELAATEQKRIQERSAQSQRDQTLLENELVVMKDLVNRVDGSQAPKPADIARLRDAVDQVRSAMTPIENQTNLHQTARTMSSRALELDRTVAFVDKLNIVQVNQSESTLKRTFRTITSDKGDQRDVSTVINVALAVSQSFDEWLADGSDDPKDIAQRLGQVPDWARPTIVDALYQWKSLHEDESDYQRAMGSELRFGKLAKSSSTDGVVIKSLDDQVLLITAANEPGQSHELVFEIDDQPFSAIQFQVLNHPSLPASGPGRGKDGKCVINDLKFEIASGDTPDDFRRLHFARSEANYSVANARFNGGYWNLSGGAGKSHFATYYFDGPQQFAKEAKLRVSFRGSSNASGSSSQNLGCFRVGILNVPTKEAYQEQSRWLEAIVSSVDNSQWRQRLWQAINEGDTNELIRLARDPAVKQQPVVDVVRLCDTLFARGEANMVNQISDSVRWTPFESPQIDGDELSIQSDGSFLATKNRKSALQHVISTEINGKVVSAIRFETMQDSRLPNNGPQLKNAAVGCVVREIKLRGVAQAGSQPRLLQIQQAFSNHQAFQDRSIAFLNDGDESNFWRLDHPDDTDVCSCVMIIDSNDAPAQLSRLVADLQTGHGGESTVGRFRFSWTSDPIAELVDGRVVAEELLADLHVREPSSYRALVGRAQIASNKVPPDIAQVQRFATAALSLRPDDAQSVKTYTRLLLAEEPEGDAAVLQHLVELAKKRIVQNNDSSVLDMIIDQQRRIGDLYTYSSQRNRAIVAFENMLRFAPDRFDRHKSLGLVYGNEGEFEKAIKMLSEARRRQPHDDWVTKDLADRYLSVGRFQEAAELMQDVPESVVPPITLAVALAGSERYQEAIQAWNRAANSESLRSRTSAEHRILIAIAYAELEQWDEARNMLDQVTKKSKNHLVAHLAHAAIAESTGGASAVTAYLEETRREFKFILDALSIEIMRQSLQERPPTRFFSPKSILKVVDSMQTIQPHREQILNAQMTILIQLDRPNEAIEALNDAMEEPKRGAMEWLLVAMAHQSLDENDLATKALEFADKKRPDLQPSLHGVFDQYRRRYSQ